MVKATELRIGNYVWGGSDRHEQIAEIFRERVVTSFRGNLLNVSDYEDISPIEITQEILIKSGFTYIKSNKLEHDELGQFISQGNGFYMTEVLPEMKYVHQLQNAFYAFTGKEIEIKF